MLSHYRQNSSWFKYQGIESSTYLFNAGRYQKCKTAAKVLQKAKIVSNTIQGALSLALLPTLVSHNNGLSCLKNNSIMAD